jgi:diguanylate cyclase (GGDEF)-like protein
VKYARRDRVRSYLRALIALGAVVVLCGAAGVYMLQSLIHARVLHGAEATSSVISSLVVERNITAANLHASLSPAERADMDADVAALRTAHGLVGLEVWALWDGRLIYADSGHDADEPVMPEEERRTARAGSFVVVSSGGRDEKTLDVFLPYDVDHDGQPDTVVEVLLREDPISGEITTLTDGLYVVAGLLGAFVVGAVLTAARRHRRQWYAARHDGLTGLGNRLLLTEAATEALAEASAAQPVALLLLDLDGFKDVNDTLGHDTGDQLLVAVTERLKAQTPSATALVRLGGDEFVVLVRTSTDEGRDAALSLAEGIRQAIREPVVLDGMTIEVSASVGVAVGPRHGADLGALLKHADAAMYDAKRSGRGVRIFDPDSATSDTPNLTLLAELRHAMAAGDLCLRYLPQCDADGRVRQVEALVCWQHPSRGLLLPADFLPMAERTSLIIAITGWALREAARQCATWRADGSEVCVSVRIAARDLLNDDLPVTVKDAVSAVGLPHGALRLEISEAGVLADPPRAAQVLGELAALEVPVSIDGCGTAYRSLSELRGLPVRALKIDPRLVGRLLASPVDELLVHSVIELARELGADSVGYGVPSDAIRHRLVELGCDEVHGSVLDGPLHPDAFTDWLRTRRSTGLRTADA